MNRSLPNSTGSAKANRVRLRFADYLDYYSRRVVSNKTVLVSLDFARAFDVLNFNVILASLRAHSFDESTIRWFQFYLTSRSQQIVYVGARSSPLVTTFGAPEGSLLGPKIFNLYLDSLLRLLPNNCVVVYADDVYIICSGKSLADAVVQIQSLLDITCDWAASRLMVLSVTKCFDMHFPASIKKPVQQSPPVTINGATAKIVDKVRILGITFTSP